MKTQFKNKRAFTLIELLIVIAIIGILFIVLVSKVDFATDKAKASGVQTDFRSFQTAFEQVARENSGYATLGWDTGDHNGDRIRNSYDKGDNGAGGGIAQNGIQDGTEVFVGSKTYGENWSGTYTLVNPDNSKDASAFVALENAINANLDPKLHITLTPNTDASGNLTGSAAITMANQARDPWKNEYAGDYISNATVDKLDRGSIVMYSTGANGQLGSNYSVSGGLVGVEVPGSNINGKDDYVLSVTYSYANGYGELQTGTAGFSNNQNTLTSTPIVDNGVNAGGMSAGTGSVPGGSGTPEEPAPIPVVGSATFADGVTLSWDELLLESNATQYVYNFNALSTSEIGADAFLDCTSLTSIEIPSSVTTIGDGAFSCCYNLVSVTIPDSVTSIGASAFLDCTILTGIAIPNSVTSIGASAFSYCYNLASVTIPDSVTTIGDWAFEECTNLTSVTIGDNVESIGNNAFQSCSSLTSVVIPDGVTCIGEFAFYLCTGLTSVVIPDSVTSIGMGAFSDCASLESIAIPSGVTSIEGETFYLCESLTNIIIPDSVTNIGFSAFYLCTSLENITFGGTTAQWNSITKGVEWNYDVPATYVQCSGENAAI